MILLWAFIFGLWLGAEHYPIQRLYICFILVPTFLFQLTMFTLKGGSWTALDQKIQARRRARRRREY